MIVLDESLLSLRLAEPIARWYPGQVSYITDLRPNTTIKDESIPKLLQQAKSATFVTTNVTDFWRHISAHSHYCVVCLPLPNERLRELPDLLRRLLRLPEFKTKSARMGKVVRVSHQQIQYYEVNDNRIRTLEWPN